MVDTMATITSFAPVWGVSTRADPTTFFEARTTVWIFVPPRSTPAVTLGIGLALIAFRPLPPSSRHAPPQAAPGRRLLRGGLVQLGERRVHHVVALHVVAEECLDHRSRREGQEGAHDPSDAAAGDGGPEGDPGVQLHRPGGQPRAEDRVLHLLV